LAHFACVAPPFLGHLNPLCALAEALQRRGHRITFLHVEDARPLLEQRGFAYRSVGAQSHPPGALAAINARLRRPNGPLGLMDTVRRVAGLTDMLCRELPGALREIGADMLLCDQVEAAGGLVADHVGLPLVSVASALPINWEPLMPPIFTPWRYGPSFLARKRNMAGYRASMWLMRPISEVIAAHAAAWSLGRRHRPDHCLSRLLQVAQIVPGLDLPRTRLPPQVHHCGPLRTPGEQDAEVDFSFADGRPLAYASLGSLQGSRYGLFRRIAEAGERAGLQVMLTHAGGLSPEQVARLPGRPAAFATLPQPPVLRRASVAVLHGGLNTVLDAMAAGVPAVVVPIAFEQGAIGVRVEAAGAGLCVSRRWRTTAILTRAIRRAAEDPAYRAAAQRVSEEIRAAGGAERAADLVETVLRTGRAVLRPAA
jgi:zeaxanthin glucosyltransferase